MLFNSLQYCLFLPIVVFTYYFLPHRFRWALLLSASFYFYMCWKPEYIFLVLISTVVDYYAGVELEHYKNPRIRKLLLAFSLTSNLGMLFTFKYFNFFSDSVRVVFNSFNIFYDSPTFHLLLPVGISFYVFQSLSYVVDVYYGRIRAERHFGYFALFVTFFPQLVAGPIERAADLQPELKKNVKFNKDNILIGLLEIGWGMFKKVVIADRLSGYVNSVYNNPTDKFGMQVVIATVFFAYQIYCDFSGYSDIAIGSARLLGVDLRDNFNSPYHSSSFSEFWKRWHISLSSWFRDYVYIPLGGNRISLFRTNTNLFVTFLISGLWHGANWTFVVWGAIHGTYLFIENVCKRNVVIAKYLSIIPKPIKIIFIFSLVCFAWIFFRANKIDDAFILIRNIFKFSLAPQDIVKSFDLPRLEFKVALFFILTLELVAILKKNLRFADYVVSRPIWIRLAVYYLLPLVIIFFGIFGKHEFIYFQF